MVILQASGCSKFLTASVDWISFIGIDKLVRRQSLEQLSFQMEQIPFACYASLQLSRLLGLNQVVKKKTKKTKPETNSKTTPSPEAGMT